MSSDESVRLHVNNGPPIPCRRGRTLLSSLHEAGIFPPSACGGRGVCGLCRVRVESGADASPTAAELKKLTASELTDGFRLSCQIALDADISVTIPESYFTARRHDVRVTGIEALCHDTRRIRLAFAQGATFSFTAGQYVRLTIPPHGARAETATRSYSIASPSEEKRFVELVVRRVPFGVATGYLHDVLQEGDVLSLDGPYGDFGLKKTAAAALFVAGGSGIAPFESILADAGARSVRKKITMIFGAVRRADLYDLDKIAELGGRLPGFHFVPTLSCPDSADGWEGERGLVTEVAVRLFPEMKGMEAYLCGSPGMIDACRTAFCAGGMREADISYDLFG